MYGLDDHDIERLRAAYLREQKTHLDKAVDEATAWALEHFGVTRPSQPTPQDIIEEVKRLKQIR